MIAIHLLSTVMRGRHTTPPVIYDPMDPMSQDVRRVLRFAILNVKAPRQRVDPRNDITMLVSVGISMSPGRTGHVSANNPLDDCDQDSSVHANVQDTAQMGLVADTNQISSTNVCKNIPSQDEGPAQDATASRGSNSSETNCQQTSLHDVHPTSSGPDIQHNCDSSSNEIPALQIEHTVSGIGDGDGAMTMTNCLHEMLSSGRVQSMDTCAHVPASMLMALIQDACISRVLQLARLSLLSANRDEDQLEEMHIVLSVGATMLLVLYGHCDLVDDSVSKKQNPTVQARLQSILQIHLMAEENVAFAKEFCDDLTALSTTIENQSENNDFTTQDTPHLHSETMWEVLKEAVRVRLFGEKNGISYEELDHQVLSLRSTLEQEQASTRTSETSFSSQHGRTLSESTALASDVAAAKPDCPVELANLDSSLSSPIANDSRKTSINVDEEIANTNAMNNSESISWGKSDPCDGDLNDALLIKTRTHDCMFAPFEHPSAISIPSVTVVTREIIAHAKALVDTLAAICDIIKPRKRVALLDESVSASFAPGLMAFGKIAAIFAQFVWTSEPLNTNLIPNQMEKAMEHLLESADELLSLYETFINAYDAMLTFLTTSCKTRNAEYKMERPLLEIQSFIELLGLFVRAQRVSGKSETRYASAVVVALRRLHKRPIWNSFLLRLRTRYSRRFCACLSQNGNLLLGTHEEWRLIKRGEVRIQVLPWIWIRYTLYLFDHVLIWTSTRPSTKISGLVQLFSDLRVRLFGRNHNEVSIISPASDRAHPLTLQFICPTQTDAVMWILLIEDAIRFRPSSTSQDEYGAVIPLPSAEHHDPYDRALNFRVGTDLEWHTDIDTIVQLKRPMGEGSLGAASLCVFRDTKDSWVIEHVQAVSMKRLKLILCPWFTVVDGSIESIFAIGGPTSQNYTTFWILKEYITGETLKNIAHIRPPDMRQIAYLTLGLIKSLAAIHSGDLWYGELEFGSILISCQGMVKLAIPRRFRSELLKESSPKAYNADTIKSLQGADIRFLGCVVSELVSLYQAGPFSRKKPSLKRTLWKKFVQKCCSNHASLDILASHPFVLFETEPEVCVRSRLVHLVGAMRSANNFTRC